MVGGSKSAKGGSISAVTPGLIMLLFDMLRLFSKLVGNSSHLLYRHQVFFHIFVFRGSVPCEQGRPEAVFKLVINIFICRASPNVPLVCRAQETSDRLRNLVKLSPHGNHSLNTDLTWPYYVIILKQSRFCERSRPNLVRHAYGTTSKKSNTW